MPVKLETPNLKPRPQLEKWEGKWLPEEFRVPKKAFPTQKKEAQRKLALSPIGLNQILLKGRRRNLEAFRPKLINSKKILCVFNKPKIT